MRSRNGGKGGSSRGRGGSASKTRVVRVMLPRARWWWTRAAVLWVNDVGREQSRHGATGRARRN
jgi:hypothetical protein